MANRYRQALARGKEEYERAVREDVALLEVFGLQLLSVEGGLRAVVISEVRERINPWDVIVIDFKVWRWLRPLLVRLRSLEAHADGKRAFVAAAN